MRLLLVSGNLISDTGGSRKGTEMDRKSEDHCLTNQEEMAVHTLVVLHRAEKAIHGREGAAIKSFGLTPM